MGVVVFDLDADRAAGLAGELGDGVVGVGGTTIDDGDVGAAIDAATALGPIAVLVNVAGGGVGGGRTVGRDGTPARHRVVREDPGDERHGHLQHEPFGLRAMGANEPDEDGQRGWWSTPPPSPAWRVRAGRSPTGRPRRPSWA